CFRAPEIALLLSHAFPPQKPRTAPSRSRRQKMQCTTRPPGRAKGVNALHGGGRFNPGAPGLSTDPASVRARLKAKRKPLYDQVSTGPVPVVSTHRLRQPTLKAFHSPARGSPTFFGLPRVGTPSCGRTLKGFHRRGFESLALEVQPFQS